MSQYNSQSDSENEEQNDLSEIQEILSTPKVAKPKKAAFLKFICFRPEVVLDFTMRHVFSCLCDLYFRQRKMPSAVRLRRETGCSHKTVSAALHDLRFAGIVAGYRPVYREGMFFEKKSFTMKRWWKGIQTRTVTPTPATAIRTVPDGKTEEVAGRGIGRDVVVGFVSYANTRRKRITTSYLAKSTGMASRTIQRITHQLIQSGRLRSGKAGLEVLASGGETLWLHNNRLVEAHLKDCHDLELRKRLKHAGALNTTKFFSCLQTAVDETTGRTNYHKLANTLAKAVKAA